MNVIQSFNSNSGGTFCTWEPFRESALTPQTNRKGQGFVLFAENPGGDG